MKKRFSITLTVLLLICSLIFGCGSNTTETTSTAETIQDVVFNQEVQEEVQEQPKAEETTTEELTTDTEEISTIEEAEEAISTESEEEPEELPTESEEEGELSDDEEAEETSKGDMRDGPLYITLHQLDDIGINGPVKVPNEVKEEYKKRTKEGFSYEPEKVHNDYTAYSDAHIIEMVNARYLELHNKKRVELGLEELEEVESLHDVATIRAEEVSYFFNHTRPNGELADELIPWDGVSYQRRGENISYVLGSESNIDYYYGSKSIIPERRFYIDLANDGFELLWDSPSHYENITHPEYKYIGIDSYIVRDKNGVIMIVTAFEFASDVF